jgi:SAM-dependent methyltransferase
MLDYAVDLRRRGRAQATANRRLGTIRALVRTAHDLRLVDWLLDVPNEGQVSKAIEDGAAGNVPYLLPRHSSEIDRLDVQHYAMQLTLEATYLAPVESPERVVDVGCGTGQWGFEVCAEFPAALVVGLDLVAGKPERPPGYRLVKGNLLHGLPFGDDRFDFVHQRFLSSGVPTSSWPTVVEDLVRVARPGGWVELVESVMRVEGLGPANERLSEVMLGLAGAMGLDTTNAVFNSLDDRLRRAGLASVMRREVSLPIGLWGGTVGSLMATDMRAACTRVLQLLEARGTLGGDEAHDLLQRAQEEWERYRPSWTVAVAFGRKPA